jgi:poly-beta-1,6 N-acetyl-D-glucosamine synthase
MGVKRLSLLLIFFYTILGISFARLIARVILSTTYHFHQVEDTNLYPLISIIVPAYNEEITIQKCLNSLLKLDYPKYEVIVVDDGSTDHTLEKVKCYESPTLKVLEQSNQGKAKALNAGIQLTKGDIVVTVDADTLLHKNALKHIGERFIDNRQLGAIAGNVKVDPASGLLNTLQAAEYTLGINLIRKAQSVFGCVMIVPGPIAALRKEAIEKAGYFSDETFAEDFDITMQILKAGYKVQYEDKAIAYTDAPQTLEDLLKQRRRWYRGMIQVLDKHRNMLFRPEYGIAGSVGVPSLWLDIVSTILNAALILLAVFTVFLLGQPIITLTGLIMYFGFEIAVGIYTLSLDPIRSIREFIILPLLSFYNLFLDGIRLMTFSEELVNIGMTWEKPQR